jgi:peptidoglycan hydrolase-like protein with peptidoglycan-binding domain
MPKRQFSRIVAIIFPRPFAEVQYPRREGDVMSLRSRLFAGDTKLEAAARSNPAHIVPGDLGPHVGKVQQALRLLDGDAIDPAELSAERYGPSTARAVLSYKTKHNIINRAYQTQPDNIVGIMTMASLDDDMARIEQGQNSVKIVSCRGPLRTIRRNRLA